MSVPELKKEISEVENLIGRAIARQEAQTKLIELLREKVNIIKRYLVSINC